jgi:hypothetical protein
VKVPHWRLYFVRRLRSAITDRLPEDADWGEVTAAFDMFTLRFPWGALDAAIGQVVPNTLESTAVRINAVLSFWNKLDTLRYIDRRRQVIGLTELVAQASAGLRDLWLDARGTDLKSDLVAALERAATAQPELACERLARHMAMIARTNENVIHKDILTNEMWLRNRLAALTPERLSTLRTGNESAVRRELYKLDAEYSL